MRNEYVFDTQEEFLEKLKSLAQEEIKPSAIKTYTPFHVRGMEQIFKLKPSAMRYITLAGALSGFTLGFTFIIYTVIVWPLVTGGKAIVSIPAFVILAFECTVLAGGVISFLGFLHLVKLPNVMHIIKPRDCGNQFIIVVEDIASATDNMATQTNTGEK